MTNEIIPQDQQVDFFTMLPNEILDAGFSIPMLVTMVWLHRRADWETGQAKWVTAEVIAHQLNAIPQGASAKEVLRVLRMFQRAMEHLEEHGWITRHIEKGRKGWYWVTLHNYVSKRGALKGQVLNQSGTATYKENQAPPVADVSVKRARNVHNTRTSKPKEPKQ